MSSAHPLGMVLGSLSVLIGQEDVYEYVKEQGGEGASLFYSPLYGNVYLSICISCGGGDLYVIEQVGDGIGDMGGHLYMFQGGYKGGVVNGIKGF